MVLRVLAPQIAGALHAVALLDLDPAHRQRRPDGAHRTEPAASRLGRTKDKQSLKEINFSLEEEPRSGGRPSPTNHGVPSGAKKS